MDYINEVTKLLANGLADTLYMVFFSSVLSIVLGMIAGVALYSSKSALLHDNKAVATALEGIVNIGRSVPFVIIIIAAFPLSRIIVGTAIGRTAAVIPLTIAAIPFVARVVESALNEVDIGVIEAAKSMGATNREILYKVVLSEALQSLISAVTITIINIVGYSAMAGVIGGGGLGDIAWRYGGQRFRTDLLIYTIIILVIVVQIIQALGNRCLANALLIKEKLLLVNQKFILKRGDSK